jgi:hypothetical protein
MLGSSYRRSQDCESAPEVCSTCAVNSGVVSRLTQSLNTRLAAAKTQLHLDASYDRGIVLIRPKIINLALRFVIQGELIAGQWIIVLLCERLALVECINALAPNFHRRLSALNHRIHFLRSQPRACALEAEGIDPRIPIDLKFGTRWVVSTFAVELVDHSLVRAQALKAGDKLRVRLGGMRVRVGMLAAALGHAGYT